MTSDVFGRALRDRYTGEKDAPLIERDGPEKREHPVEGYFEEFDSTAAHTRLARSRLDGPLLDLGAGSGRDALYFQERFETVAIDVSARLVETMGDRGVDDVRRADMFALRDQFERDRFRAALVLGTQLGLAGSMQGLRRFLGDLSHVTRPGATVVLDAIDPDADGAASTLGYRDDPTAGLAFVTLHFEYEQHVGETLLFRLFGPDRLRAATVGTGWTVTEIGRGLGRSPYYYQAALAKR